MKTRISLYRFAAASAILVALALIATRLFAQSASAAPRVITLDQGWTPSQSAMVHYTTQGSVLMPAAWVRALRQPDGTLVMAPANLKHLGFLDVDAPKTAANPYG